MLHFCYFLLIFFTLLSILNRILFLIRHNTLSFVYMRWNVRCESYIFTPFRYIYILKFRLTRLKKGTHSHKWKAWTCCMVFTYLYLWSYISFFSIFHQFFTIIVHIIFFVSFTKAIRWYEVLKRYVCVVYDMNYVYFFNKRAIVTCHHLKIFRWASLKSTTD